MTEVVTFRVGGSRYALPVGVVAEVVETPSIEPLPTKHERIAGVARVRGRWIPVVEVPDSEEDTVADAAPDEGSVLLILGSEQTRLGLRVKDFGEVVTAGEGRRLEGSGAEALVDLNGQLVRILDLAALLGSDEQILGAEGELKMGDRTETPQLKVVAFRVGDEVFGVDVMKVFEVVQIPEIRSVPKAPEFVEGVAEVRTAVVPVIDMRKRFSVAAGETGTSPRLLVTEVDERAVGLVVDDVPGVADLDAESISPPPEFFKGLAGRYLDGIAKLEDRLIILLNLNEILSSAEKIELNAVVEQISEGNQGTSTRKKSTVEDEKKSGRTRRKKADG